MKSLYTFLSFLNLIQNIFGYLLSNSFYPTNSINPAFNQQQNIINQGFPNAFQQMSNQIPLQQARIPQIGSQAFPNQFPGLNIPVQNIHDQFHNIIQNAQEQQMNLMRQLQEIHQRTMQNLNIQNAGVPNIQHNPFLAERLAQQNFNANPGLAAQQMFHPQIVPPTLNNPRPVQIPNQPSPNFPIATKPVQNQQVYPTQEVAKVTANSANPNLNIPDIINPFDVLKEKLASLNPQQLQSPLIRNLLDLLKTTIESFNTEFSNNFKQSVEFMNTLDAKIIQQINLVRGIHPNLMYQQNNLNGAQNIPLQIPQLINGFLENTLSVMKTNIIEVIKKFVKVMKIDPNSIYTDASDFIPSSNASLSSILQFSKDQLNKSLNNLTDSANYLVNLNSSIASILKNLKDNSAILSDDGATFRAYLLKINSTEETLSKWDSIVKNKDSTGKLNTTSYAKLEPFCNCNDVVTCNCCLSLNLTLINQQVCLEVTAPKSDDGTKLAIIIDSNKQDVSKSLGSNEKIKFNFVDIANGEFELARSKEVSKPDVQDEFCGLASLNIYGLNYPALPLGCFSIKNHTITFINSLK